MSEKNVLVAFVVFALNIPVILVCLILGMGTPILAMAITLAGIAMIWAIALNIISF